MKPGTSRLQPKTPNAIRRDRLARWISFAALVALLAMATLPITSGSRDIAAGSTPHRSATWHG